MMASGRLPTAELVTHRFELGQMEEAYDVFGRAAETGAVKVALGSPQHTVVEAAQPVARG
jgi:alcohol dehydrogenase